jgi:hypothetical protein
LSSNLRIQLAHTKEHFEQALKLLAESNSARSAEASLQSSELWLLKQHALPSTNTIIALKDNKVVGALSLFGENPFLLPLEHWVDLSSYKESLGGRVAEVSMPGFSAEYKNDPNLLFALYHFTACFGSTYCHYESFLTLVSKDWATRYAKTLHYEPVSVRENISGQCLSLNPRDTGDYRKEFTQNFRPEFCFPEKKFFLVAHQNLKPDVLNYLFNHRTQLFSKLNDFELRVIKNIYNHGEYANYLPQRNTSDAYARLPKHRRFPMDCAGHLSTPDGRRMHFVVEDVSKEGLRLRTEQPLKQGQTHALIISIGVMKQTEIIARTIWVNEMANTAGLEVSSGDKNWAKLIEYLEKDFLRLAA